MSRHLWYALTACHHDNRFLPHHGNSGFSSGPILTPEDQMPYELYDTGWIKSIYAVLCLTWYLVSSGTMFHITSATSYNNLFIPLVELFNKSCGLIGNIIVWIGNGIIRYESFVFQHFNYINPIYNGSKFIETGFSNLNINAGNPSYQSNPYNSSNNKASTGKHLSSYFARKRRHR
jgi:hypothetical protein